MTISTTFQDLRTLRYLLFHKAGGSHDADRLEAFYRGQADDYDRFRNRLLHGREALFSALPFTAGSVWYDLGAGTGSNLEIVGNSVESLGRVCLIDLCPSLLRVAEARVARKGWKHVSCSEADVCTLARADSPADIVTFSYSLTMIPEWPVAIRRAVDLLKPGGHIGVVDFFIPAKHPAPGRLRLGWCRRAFWRLWFERDNVFLGPDHISMLRDLTQTVHFEEHLGTVPYLPGFRVPYYILIGRKPDTES